MKIITLKFALSLSFLGSTVFAEPIQLRCHMDSCSWANIQIINKLDNGEDGSELYEVSSIYGSSFHKDDLSYPDSYSSEINVNWEKNIEKVMIYCSLKNPTVFGGNLLIQTFEFPNVYGYEMSALDLYMHTCHGIKYLGNDEIFTDLGYNKILRKQFNSVKELLQK
jgi:hypothetical protein|tara:strand:+ start:631 stop:1128 length:498 start_codon:yes stop_codon:yes gene_type:complete